MKLINVYGIKMSKLEEMVFSKHLGSNSISMNTKTSEERFVFTLNWLSEYLGVPESMKSGLLNRQI